METKALPSVGELKPRCGCFWDRETGNFEPCSDEHQQEYVEHLQTERDREHPPCGHDWHKGPGCPVWHGAPDKFVITAIGMVTTMHKFVLHMQYQGQWRPVRTAKEYEYLNTCLEAYKLEYRTGVRTADR